MSPTTAARPGGSASGRSSREAAPSAARSRSRVMPTELSFAHGATAFCLQAASASTAPVTAATIGTRRFSATMPSSSSRRPERQACAWGGAAPPRVARLSFPPRPFTAGTSTATTGACLRPPSWRRLAWVHGGDHGPFRRSPETAGLQAKSRRVRGQRPLGAAMDASAAWRAWTGSGPCGLEHGTMSASAAGRHKYLQSRESNARAEIRPSCARRSPALPFPLIQRCQRIAAQLGVGSATRSPRLDAPRLPRGP
jgi:hypothetical protein